MATIYSNIVGAEFFDNHHGARGVCRLRMHPATSYTASSDSFQIGGGGKLFGVSTSDSLETQLASIRRDGKTLDVVAGMGAGAGGSSSTTLYIDTVAVSGNNLTAEIANAGSTEQDLTVANSVIPMEVWVAYDLS